MGKTCPTCIDLVNGCDPIKTDNVIYSGPNLPCSTINTNDSLTLALQKIDDIICTFSGGATNLSYIASPINGTVTSSTGTDAIIPLADSINAGLLSPGDFTKIQDAHPPVTIGTPNGLSIVALTQILSLALADTSTTGALSFTDWNTFNDKQPAIGYVPADDANVLHRTGNESFVGRKTSTNTGTTELNGLTLINNGTTDTSNVISLINSSTGRGLLLTNAGSGSGMYMTNSLSGFAIQITNNGTGSGEHIANRFGGIGLSISNGQAGSTGTGLSITNQSSSPAIAITSFNSGDNIVVNQASTSTGFNFIGRNNGVNTFTVDKLGNTVIGGTETLSTLPTTSAGTYDLLTRNATTGVVEKITSASVVGGSGTLNTIPKFTPNGTTLGNSSITDSGTGVGGIVNINNFIGGTVTRVLPAGNTLIDRVFNLTNTDNTSQFLTRNIINVNEDGVVDGFKSPYVSNMLNITKTTNQPSSFYTGFVSSVLQQGAGTNGTLNAIVASVGGTGTGNVTGVNLYSGYTSAFSNTFPISQYIGLNLFFNPQNNVTNAYGVRIGDLFGSTISRGIDLGVSAGTGKYNVYAGGTASNLLLGTTAIGTASELAKLTIGGVINASGTVARTVYIGGNVTATANNDTLVGLDVNPTFTNGAFTGIRQFGVRLSHQTTIGAIQSGGSTLNLLWSDNNNTASLQGATGILFYSNGTQNGRMFNTGNWVLQNGGAFVDNGYRLDIQGTTRLGSTTTIQTVPTTSAGGYDFLTRNTGTGVIEKIASGGFELLANKQNSMVIDGTGTKYPTVDAVNFQTNYIARAIVATGFLDTTDPFSISRFDDNTLAITATQFGIAFSQRFKTLPFAPSDGIINVIAQNVPLSAIGLGVDGTYIRFVGIQIDGTIVWSPTQFIQSPSVCQLGLVLVKVVGGVTSFIDINRTAITMPDVAAYSNLDTTATGVKASTAIAAIPGTLSHSNIQGKLVGISVAWGTSNNDSKTIPLLNPTSFTRLHPGNALTVVPPATFTVMDPVNYWNGAALIAVPGGAGVSTVQRLLYTVNGNFVWQYGEATYANLVAAQNNILQAIFTNILPEGTFAEVGRMAITKGCTDLASSNAQYYPTGQSGGGGTSPIAPTAWGAITGNIDDQLDLKAKLDARPTGSGTTNTIPKFTATSVLGNSSITDSGTGVGGKVDINNFIGGTVTRVLPTGNSTIGQTFNLTGTDGTSNLLNRFTVNLNEDGFISNGSYASEINLNVNKTTNQTSQFGALNVASAHIGSGNINTLFAVRAGINAGSGTGTIANLYYYDTRTGPFANTFPVTNFYGVNLPFTPQNNVTNAWGIRIGELYGSTISRGIDLGVTAGTGKYNIFAQGTASNHLLGNTLIGTTNNIGAKLNVDGTISAVTGVARVVNINGSLTATANNDVLVGLDINPTFTNGAFTGVTTYPLRVPSRGGNSCALFGAINQAGAISFARGSDGVAQGFIGYSSLTTPSDFTILSGGGSGTIGFLTGLGRQGQFFQNGNLLLQNGGTFTDNGFRLDVQGTARITGRLTTDVDANINGLTIGKGAGSSIENTAIGREALFSNVSGVSNTAIGAFVLKFNTGSGNTGVGTSALASFVGGLSNTGVGFAVLSSLTSGDRNVALGAGSGSKFAVAGTALTTATDSIFIGQDARALANAQTNQIVIGNQAIGNGDNSVTVGNDSIVKTLLKGNVGIGTPNPITKLHVEINAIPGNQPIFLRNLNTAGQSYLQMSNNNGSASLLTGMNNTAFVADPLYGDPNDGIILLTAEGKNLNIINSSLQELDYGIVFKTSGVDGLKNRMTIKGSGNVGIGVTSPSAKLDIGSLINTDAISIAGWGAVRYSTGDVLDIGSTNASQWAAIRFMSNGNEAMRIVANGNVGVGITTPDSKLTVLGNGHFISTVNGNLTALSITNNDATPNLTRSVSMSFKLTDTVGSIKTVGEIIGYSNDVNNVGGGLVFTTRASDTLTERLKITASGVLMSPPTYNNTGGAAASLFITTDGTIYRSTSSKRYKKNIKVYDKGIDEVMKLKPVYFESRNIREKGVRYAGFIAEDLDEQGLKEFVEYDDKGRPDAIGYTHLTSLLVKAIQELKSEVDALKLQIQTM